MVLHENCRRYETANEQGCGRIKLKQGMLTPQSKPPKSTRTPKQKCIYNKFGDMISRSKKIQKKKSICINITKKSRTLYCKYL